MLTGVRRHPHLLEISAWPWLDRLSREGGRIVTLGDVPGGEWDRIAERGFDLVFLMGVWKRSPIGRAIARTHPGLVAAYDRVLPGWTDADVAGSPYSIQIYEPDDRMGGWSALDSARGELRARGLGLILDFVPNHTGFDHEWVASFPERYVLGTEEDHRAEPDHFRPMVRPGGTLHVACGRDPYFAPWTDVAQLNHFNPDTRRALNDTLRAISAHCDGVRCDMAMLALNDVFERTWRPLLRGAWPRPEEEFWSHATRATPELLYVAEVYWGLEGAMLEQGFHAAYDKRLLDGLEARDAGRRTRDLLTADPAPDGRLARFIENHDEPRSAVTLAGILPAAASLVATVPGTRLFFDGQMEGRRINPPVQLGRWPDEPPNESVSALYERVLGVAADRLWHDGEWKLLEVSAAWDDTFPDIVAYRWRTSTALGVVVVNLAVSRSKAHVALAAELQPGAAFEFRDQLTGETYRWTREALERTGLYVQFEGGGAHLFLVVADPAMIDQ
jgi:glycosidase